MSAAEQWSDLLPEGFEPGAAQVDDARRILLRPASTIQVRPVHWLWEGRLPTGSLSLLAGREGIGKSTAAYTLAGDVTRGRLAGRFYGQPKSVIVAASEDSWSHTIVPRLMAAGADLDRVFRVEVTVADVLPGELVLPDDIDALVDHVRDVDASLVLLDPLISRLDGRLDTHRDAEVRRALEPVAHLADRTGAVVLGLIHVNKSGGTDPLSTVMASKAFVAVARSVLYAMTDPDDEHRRLLGLAKNNLGRLDMPTLRYRIDGCVVADTDEGPVWTGRLIWDGETDQSITDALEAASAPGGKSAMAEATAWLADWLEQQGGGAESSAAKAAGKAAGHSRATLERAAKKLDVAVDQHGFPRRTYWTLPASPRPSTGVGALPVILGLAAWRASNR
ncbi:AAA family ATPase [Acidimicrobiaceae bacterium USS-CC1]|uniref:AAA family ATPase n=1 Tax=Acidiferrimicrobium australe TaxID=2664430 RepID=A0ABW9QVL7_9ACTN|nr:AAA family ATPase [Acidiferrimicrobium australe]